MEGDKMAKKEQVTEYIVQHSLGTESTPFIYIQKDTRVAQALGGAIASLATAKYYYLVLMENEQIGLIPVSALGKCMEGSQVFDLHYITTYKSGMVQDHMAIDFGDTKKPVKFLIPHGRQKEELELLKQLVVNHGIASS